jgi:hypothetical protein
MRLVIRGPEKNEGLHGHTERRVGFALGRFAPRVASVTVVVADRDGEVASCLVRVRCSPFHEIVEEVADEDAHAAIERAVARAARAVERALAGRARDALGAEARIRR